MSMTSNYQFRASFQDTKKFQDKLREKLYKLSVENRCIKDSNEMNEFFEMFSNSTLGLGTENSFIVLPDHKIIKISNLWQFISLLFYYRKKNVDKEFFFNLTGKDNNYDVEIGYIWNQVLIRLLGVFPFALAMAYRTSKEREKKEMSEGASLDGI